MFDIGTIIIMFYHYQFAIIIKEKSMNLRGCDLLDDIYLGNVEPTSKECVEENHDFGC